MTSYLRDAAGVAGVASIAYGSWAIYEPAGFIIAGALVLMVAVASSLAAAKRGA